MFNKSIFGWTLYEKLLSTALVSLMLIFLCLIYAALYESTSVQFSELTNSLPPEVSSILGSVENSATPEGWVNLEFYSLTFPFTLVILAIIVGGNLIGKEESESTLELLLASPVSRVRLLLEKYLATVVQIGIVSASGFVGLWAGKLLYPPFDLDMGKVAWATFAAFLLSMIYFGITAMAQTLLKSKGKATLVGGIFFAASYIIFIAHRLSDSLDWLGYFTPFYYYDNEGILFDQPELSNFVVMAGVTVITLAITVYSFRGRDTGV